MEILDQGTDIDAEAIVSSTGDNNEQKTVVRFQKGVGLRDVRGFPWFVFVDSEE